jgi:hypothetical protein
MNRLAVWRVVLAVGGLGLALAPVWWPAWRRAPATPVVAATVALGPLRQSVDVMARDGAASVESGGVAYWFFNDTILARANAAGAQFLDNSVGFTRTPGGLVLEGDVTDAAGGVLRVVPFTAAELAWQAAHGKMPCAAAPCGETMAIWPGQPVLDAARHRLLIPIYVLTRRTGPEWTPYGAGFAVGVLSASGALTGVERMAGLLWEAGEFAYADQPVVMGDWLYAFGRDTDWNTFQTEDKLARVKLTQLGERGAWQYYLGGDRWGRDPALAAPVFFGGDAGTSVVWNKYLGRWLAVYTPAYSGDVYFRVAQAVWGPWSEPALLFRTQAGWHGVRDYGARMHQEMTQQEGRVEFVSYARATGLNTQNVEMEKVVFGAAPKAGR